MRVASNLHRENRAKCYAIVGCILLINVCMIVINRDFANECHEKAIKCEYEERRKPEMRRVTAEQLCGEQFIILIQYL